MKIKIKNWIIRKLGGYTQGDVDVINSLADASIKEANSKHESYVDWHDRGYELAHRKDGSGVASLIREILFDVMQENLGDAFNPAPGVSRADVMETDTAVTEWTERVADDIKRFCDGIKERNFTSARWGVPHCKCGVKAMMGMSAGRIDSPLGRFARIWRKEHPDTRQKDVLDDEQKMRWAKLDKTLKCAVNVAVNDGFEFWK